MGICCVTQGTQTRALQHYNSKTSILQHSAFFIVQLSHPFMTIGKTIALTRRTFVSKVMTLLFNMLSRLVITFLPRSKRLLLSWLQSPCNESVLLIRQPKYCIFSFTSSFSNEYSGLISFRIADQTETLKNSSTRGSKESGAGVGRERQETPGINTTIKQNTPAPGNHHRLKDESAPSNVR